MLTRFVPRLSYANVVATLALVLALGGGAYAATKYVSADGRIHSCVQKGGQILAIKPGKRCSKGTTSLVWDQRGPRGLSGTNGRNGANGAAVVARTRQLGTLTTETHDTPGPGTGNYPIINVDQDVPLQGNGWTQRATEIDHMVGQLTFSTQATDCRTTLSGGAGTAPGFVEGQVFIGATRVATFSWQPNGASTQTLPIDFGGKDVFESGSAQARTLSVKVADNCDAAGSGHFLIRNVAIDVVAYR